MFASLKENNGDKCFVSLKESNELDKVYTRCRASSDGLDRGNILGIEYQRKKRRM